MALNPIFEGIVPQNNDADLFQEDLESIPLKKPSSSPDLIKEMTPPPDTSLTGRLTSWTASLFDIK